MTTSSIPAPTTGAQVHLGGGMVVSLTDAIRRLRRLPLAERNVLALRLGLIGRSRSVVRTASLLGMTSQRVQRIERQAGSKLRHPSCGRADEAGDTVS
jgi:DNA-directed RNA polymerase sigma subunit (sigma70/sigma32)